MSYEQLLRRAAICRQTAAIRTSGSGETDRLLLELAGTLEAEAAALETTGERPNTADGPSVATVPTEKAGQ